MSEQRLIDLVQLHHFKPREAWEADLGDAIYEMRKKPSDVLQSDLGECQVFMLPSKGLDPAFEAVLSFIRGKLPGGQWRLQAWLNIMLPGQVILPHHHGHLNQDVVVSGLAPTDRDLWVAVFHIKGDGELIIRDGDEWISGAATPGRLLIFPSNMIHEVPGPITVERMTISVNCYPGAVTEGGEVQ